MITAKQFKHGSLTNYGQNMNKAKDTGMAIVLLALIIAYLLNDNRFVLISIALLVLNMTFPSIYKPIAKVWFNISVVLGTIMSRVILSIIFFLLVTPVGLIRKILIGDQLKLKKWKKDSSSVFDSRNHSYSKNDLEKPY